MPRAKVKPTFNAAEPAKAGPTSASNPVSRAGAKVTIACKMPSGLILRLFKMEEYAEPVMGGGSRTSKRAVQVGPSVTLNGTATPPGYTPRFLISGGYALTSNVDKDFWEEWLKQNHDLEVVTNNLVFAASDQQHAQDRAAEQKDLKHGVEPLDMSEIEKDGKRIARDHRLPKPLSTVPAGVQTYDKITG